MIVIIFGILILGILSLLFFLNRLLLLKKNIENSFSSVRTCLDERIILISRMCEFIQKNLNHEEVLLKKLEKAKKEFEQIRDCNEGIHMIKNFEKVLKNLQNLSKVYPFLESQKDYQKLMEDFLTNQDRIVYAFSSYDEGVKNYNSYRENLFILKLSKIFRFSDYEYYNE